MSDLQIVQQAVAQTRWVHNLASSLDAMEWNRGISKPAKPGLRFTTSRLLAESGSLEAEIKKQLGGLKYE